MNYPFTTEQFIGVIQEYNLSVWPVQIILLALSIIATFFVFSRHRYSSRLISTILGFFWIWMGVVYHWLFFTSINPAAKLFGIFFVIEGILFIYYGLIRSNLSYKFNHDIPSYIGIFLVILGLIIYPITGYMLGHTFPSNPTFGLPCPTTIFTFGFILLAKGSVKRLLVIPFLWSIVGFMAAISFGIKEDVLLLLSGLCAIIVVFSRRKYSKI